jgi:putative membrane protein
MKKKFDKSVREELVQTIRGIECDCSAELVVAVRARSGSYRSADLSFAAVLAFAALVFTLYSPYEFAPHWAAVDAVLFFAIGGFLCSRSNLLRRWFTTKKMRREAVRVHAAAMFYEAGIANTEAETGVLVYLSLMERRLELIADRGILRAVPPAEWNGVMAELHRVGRRPDPDEFIAALGRLGAVFAECLPPDAENPNELPDLPYFDLK